MNGLACKTCGNLFRPFHFDDIAEADPPRKPGVYAIRVVRKGKDKAEILKQAKPFLETLEGLRYGWLCGQIRLVAEIGECDIVYIGMGTNILARYEQLTWAHPAGWPVAALRYFGWGLGFGWIVHPDPHAKEKAIKVTYKQRHDKLPAFMKR